MGTHPTDTDAAIVLGMASTAMPFARSSDEQAERWLRILRIHGEAGVVLQALGVSEAPLEHAEQGEAYESSAQAQSDVVVAVTERAVAIAGARGASVVGTGDVLRAVIEVYGADFDHVLRAHGTDREAVLARLGAEQHPGE